MMSEMEWLRIFGNNLQYLLEQAGMSQRMLAVKTGLEQGSISRYVRAEQMPGIKAIINIANVLGLTVDELIDFGYMIH